ncbi:hypothetical protein BSU04_22895 [Caballeronia sordidicola]|uniref:Uncharacterized protein n=1 Tax=Caballeronia sordidicola TaxID=196367 RepID=A0A226WYJ3_CABSO|nr:hypothetical protein BSU04_22895 [Caballeronia sordidicola]
MDSARFASSDCSRWGVDALMAQGRPAEALRYAQASKNPMLHLRGRDSL